MEVLSTSSVTLIDLINLTQDIASLNAVYLGISVGIILALGGVFYLFSFKPLQEKITKQEEKLESGKKSNEEKLEQLTANVRETQKNAVSQMEKLKEELTKIIESKVTGAEKKIASLENLAREEIIKMKRNANLIELTNLWDKYYLWTLGDLEVPENALRVLIEYLEKSIEYGMFAVSTELCFNVIDDVLNKIKKERSLSSGDDRKKLHDELVNALSKLSGHDEKKAELIKKAQDILLDNN